MSLCWPECLPLPHLPYPSAVTALIGLLFITAALRPTLLRNSIRFSRQRCFSAITPHVRLSHWPYSRPGAPLLSASLNCTQSPQGLRFTRASQCLCVCVCVCVCVCTCICTVTFLYMCTHMICLLLLSLLEPTSLR